MKILTLVAALMVGYVILLVNPMMRTILIGVTGASSSGKSTIANILRTILRNCEIIHEDDFFKLEKDVPFDKKRNDRDWDCPDAIDIDKLKKTLALLKNGNMKSTYLSGFPVIRNEGGYYDYSLKSTEPPRNDSHFKCKPQTISKLKNEFDLLVNKRRYGEYRIFLVDGFLILHDVELLQQLDLTLFIKANYSTLKLRREKRIYTVEGKEWVDPEGYFDKFVWPGYYNNHKKIFINGSDEEVVKLSGGDLDAKFKYRYRVNEFRNDEYTNADDMIEEITTCIFRTIF